jgi:hypothetical protein
MASPFLNRRSLPKPAISVLVQMTKEFGQTNIYAVELPHSALMVLAKKAPTAIAFVEKHQGNIDNSPLGIDISGAARTHYFVPIRCLH